MTTIPRLPLDEYLRSLAGRCPTCGAHETQQAALCHCERNHTLDATVEAHPDASKRLEAVVRELAATGSTFSANHPKIRAVECPSKVSGAVFAQLSHKGLIRKVGTEESTLPSTRGADVKVWVGVAA